MCIPPMTFQIEIDFFSATYDYTTAFQVEHFYKKDNYVYANAGTKLISRPDETKCLRHREDDVFS